MTVFIDVRNKRSQERGEVLCLYTDAIRGGQLGDNTYITEQETFRAIPTAVISYDLADLLTKLAREGEEVTRRQYEVVRGLGAGKARHVYRLIWELPPHQLGMKRDWAPLHNGGPYSPVYYPINQAVLCEQGEWRTLTSYKSGVTTGQISYGRAGLGYGKRTDHMYAHVLPAGTVFTDEGQAIYPKDASPWTIAAYVNSSLFGAVVNEFTAQHKHCGYLNGLRWPYIEAQNLPSEAQRIFDLLQVVDSVNETSMGFVCPWIEQAAIGPGEGPVSQIAEHVRERVEGANEGLEVIDARVLKELDVDFPDRERSPRPVDYLDAFFNYSSVEGSSLAAGNLLMWCVGVAFGRWDVRMARDEELIPDLQGPFERLPRVAPGGLVGPDGLPATRDAIASEAWLRARPDVITEPEPGSWESPASITAEEYPVEVAWDGILVDDPDHEKDIVRRVREVLRYVYGREGAREIEEEALEILRADGRTPRSLRDWFRNSKATELGHSFFDFHIRRYSKSRRKAPIYWRLCSSPGRGKSSYGVWLYSHRLSEDTLWTALNEYVRPKIGVVERRKREAGERLEGAEGREARRLEGELEEADELLEELAWFEEELTKVAEEDWAPELDDGVVINLAPLRELVPWKEPEKHWRRLEKGEYDWSRTAMRCWPERVREKCREDKSLAIAHDLEELYQGG